MIKSKPRVFTIAKEAAAPLAEQPGLAEAFKAATATLHTEAERSGVIADVLRGRATRLAYALLLRNLLPVYRELERGLERHRQSPGARLLAQPEVYRAGALARDLVALAGPAWPDRLQLLPAGDHYVVRLRAIAEGNGAGLIAHAYARYLGDLSGGQILKRLLAKSLGLAPQALGFYDFPAIVDLTRFKGAYRAAIDRAGEEVKETQDLVDEAALAFQLNIDLARAVQDAAAIMEPEPAVAAFPAL